MRGEGHVRGRLIWLGQGDGEVRRREDLRKRQTKPTTTLFVVNFDVDRTRERDLEKHFEPYGRLKRVQIKKNYGAAPPFVVIFYICVDSLSIIYLVTKTCLNITSTSPEGCMLSCVFTVSDTFLWLEAATLGGSGLPCAITDAVWPGALFGG